MLASSCGGEVSVATLLDEMVSPDAVTLFPCPAYTAGQVSSHDRRSQTPGGPGWFANDDGFGCEAADTVDGMLRQVLFDRPGPGAVTRIWITTSNKLGRFKFYFDGSETPGWEIEGYDLSKTGLPILDGMAFRHTHYNGEPEKTGGNTLFLPIPYAAHCKIVFESPLSMGRTPRYYHINYRAYPAGTRVKTFDPNDAAALAGRMEEVCAALRRRPAAEGRAAELSAVIAPGAYATLDCPPGPLAISELRFNVKTADSLYAETMQKLIVEASFDGVRTVWTPLSDFSGGGAGAPAVDSYYLGSDGRGDVTVRWPMPYRRSASVALRNISARPVEVAMSVRTRDYRWDGARSLYFHASWRLERGVTLSNDYFSPQCSEWRFAAIDGRGVYAGDLLSLYNYSPAWYGEGDEKIWTDGEAYPSHFGTGTEDYYNCSWAPVVPFHTPFGGAPRADEPTSHGFNAYLRTRNLDVIPFRERLTFDLEMLSWQPGSVDYASTIFWYGDHDAKAAGCSGPKEAMAGVGPAGKTEDLK